MVRSFQFDFLKIRLMKYKKTELTKQSQNNEDTDITNNYNQ